MGQLILNDGATIKNSMIYSNTNFLPNGTQARHNTSPVVVISGNVKVEGKYISKVMKLPQEQILPQEKATADSRP